jgi:hypothetical protein
LRAIIRFFIRLIPHPDFPVSVAIVQCAGLDVAVDVGAALIEDGDVIGVAAAVGVDV